MFIPSESKKRNWEDFSFVLPCVSVGNVGQLAADLLITTLNMVHVGHVYHESIVPVVGNNPFAAQQTGKCQVTTSCEVYEDEKNKLVVMQQRSPFVKGKRKQFSNWLTDWIKHEKFHRVIVVTSSYAEERIDRQIQGSQFRYIASDSLLKLSGEEFKTMEWEELEKRLSPLESIDQSAQDGPFMPGSGVAKFVFADLKDHIPVAVVMLFCSEGDNAPDAIAMVTHLNRWLKIVKDGEGSADGADKRPTQWIIPSSWKFAFGSNMDQTLFH